MSAEAVTRTIQLILVPVVMVTACSLLVGGLLGHYASVGDRLRSLVRERFELVRRLHASAGAVGAAADPLDAERLAEIDGQLPAMVRRHRLVHHAVLAVYCAIALLVTSMFVIAVAAMAPSDWLATTVLLLFLGGVGVLLCGVVLVALEIRTSHTSLHYEVRRVSSLGHASSLGEASVAGV